MQLGQRGALRLRGQLFQLVEIGQTLSDARWGRTCWWQPDRRDPSLPSQSAAGRRRCRPCPSPCKIPWPQLFLLPALRHARSASRLPRHAAPPAAVFPGSAEYASSGAAVRPSLHARLSTAVSVLSACLRQRPHAAPSAGALPDQIWARSLLRPPPASPQPYGNEAPTTTVRTVQPQLLLGARHSLVLVLDRRLVALGEAASRSESLRARLTPAEITPPTGRSSLQRKAVGSDVAYSQPCRTRLRSAPFQAGP